MVKKVDITGTVFGRLTALRRAGTVGANARWLCVCECRGEALVTLPMLTQGFTRSCGCLRRESAARNGRSENSRRAASEQMRARHGIKPAPPPSAIDDLERAWRGTGEATP